MSDFVRLAALLSLTIPTGLYAGSLQFPYEARTVAPESEVRSGPGSRYYVTTKLTVGSAVTVHRHDPGGWAMIAPPQGSFSWVRADAVEQQPDGTGVVTVDQTVARVGTELGSAREVAQRRLAQGEAVRILGTETFDSPEDSETLLKIAAPQYEYRWIEASSLVPLGAETREIVSNNPFSMPVPMTDPAAEPVPQPVTEADAAGDAAEPEQLSLSLPTAEEITLVTDESNPLGLDAELSGRLEQASASQVNSGELRQAIRTRLSQLDAQFNAVLEQDISKWSFGTLEADYKELLVEGADSQMQQAIRSRLNSLQICQKKKADFDSLNELTAETDARDRELQSRLPTPVNRPSANPQPVAAQQTSPAPLTSGRKPKPLGRSILAASRSPQPNVRPASRVRPTRAEPQPVPRRLTPAASRPVAAPMSAAAPAGDAKPAQKPQFSGAGFIQRSALSTPNSPSYVLLAPDGRVLAYLRSAREIDWPSHLGYARGVTGPRKFDSRYGADVIDVDSIAPVRFGKSPR